MHKLGAHLSTSGGYTKALEKITTIGGNCLQIFSSSPMMWVDSKISDSDIQTFVELKHQLMIDPIYFHACYLINLADENETGRKSIKSLVNELNLAAKLGIKGSIVHTGSLKLKDHTDYKNIEMYSTVITNIQQILENTPKDTLIILENAGNRKIGKDLGELATIIDAVNDTRVRVCLDTCHLHAAGYDLSSKKTFEDFLLAFDTLIGLEKLEVVHMNDSRDQFGSFRDRHENIGKGQVGIEVFKNFLNNERTKHLSFIIETPGFDDKGPDKENLDILKGFITT